jgi:4-hydroxybenzoate polyprenyltransferase
MTGFDGLGIHANGVELFWMGISYLGFFLMTSFYRETVGDRRVVRDSNLNGVRRIVADAAVRRYLVKSTICGMLALASTMAALYPTPLPIGPRTVLYLALSMVPVLLLVLNIIDRAEKIQLHNYFEQHH